MSGVVTFYVFRLRGRLCSYKRLWCRSWMVGSPSQFYKHAQALFASRQRKDAAALGPKYRLQTIAKDLGVAVACCQYRLWWLG